MHSQNTSSQPSSFIQTNLTKIKYLNLILLALATLFAAAFLSILPSPQTSATTTSQQLPISINPTTIQVNTDESLSLHYCPWFYQPGSQGDYLFAHTNNLTSFSNIVDYSKDFPRIEGTYCAEHAALGRGYAIDDEGAFYAPLTHKTGFSSFEETLIKHKDGNIAWETGFEGCGEQNGAYARSITQGFDGDIYTIIPAACSDDTESFFAGVNKETGSVKFSSLINMGYNPPAQSHLVHPYNDGMAILDINTIRYFTFSGTELTDSNFSIQPSENVAEMVASPNGTAYVKLNGQNPTYCQLTDDKYEDIYYKKLDGQEGCIQFDKHQYSTISTMMPQPDGGLAIATRPLGNKQYILQYDDNGSLQHATAISSGSGYEIMTTRWYHFRVDAAGSIYFVQNVRQKSGAKRMHANVYKIDPQGNLDTLLTTTDANNFDQNQHHYATSRNVGLTTDKVLVTVCKGTCSLTNPPYAYTIPSSGTTTDYPRNLIGSGIPSHNVDNDGDGLNKWQEMQQQTSDSDYDTDSDGIGDYQESRWNPDRHDLFCNGYHSVCEYPTPHEKDVYVEVDWMTRPADGNIDSYTTKPNEAQIDEIKDAFAAKGIHAHFDTGQLGGGNEVPYNEVVKFGVVPNEVDFFDYKKGGDGISAQFNQDRYKIYHYMLSGYRYNSTSPANSGISLVSDDDFFVAFGSLKEEFNFLLPGQAEKAITGTIIHELGHNLCLTGGTHDVPECSFAGIDDNYGNDYPSVMNHDKQFELIDYSTGQNGANDHDDWSAIRLHDFIASNAGDEEHDLLQSMQIQSERSYTPLKLQPQYRELQNKLRALEDRIERHEDR